MTPTIEHCRSGLQKPYTEAGALSQDTIDSENACAVSLSVPNRERYETVCRRLAQQTVEDQAAIAASLAMNGATTLTA